MVPSCNHRSTFYHHTNKDVWPDFCVKSHMLVFQICHKYNRGLAQAAGFEFHESRRAASQLRVDGSRQRPGFASTCETTYLRFLLFLFGTQATGPCKSMSSEFYWTVVHFIKCRCSGSDRGAPHFFGPGIKRSEWTAAINRTDRSEMESWADVCCCLQDSRLRSEITAP